ncbi:hypothetical protein [Corynebacterium caspium]|uniref:hypothetical protein n=1 Tax=Corynebacterium caspium TaxID=234828 RepID=UPI0003A89867|nr:hypothetical protein [Corynebacterium caspium]WKD59586.1 hypothetical protein CCASP_06005 [Corynebacterium caspium DSM 44850]
MGRKNRAEMRSLYRKGLSYFDIMDAQPENWQELSVGGKPGSPLGTYVKKKCCRSNPRCIACPVVHQRLAKAGDYSADAIRLARRW